MAAHVTKNQLHTESSCNVMPLHAFLWLLCPCAMPHWVREDEQFHLHCSKTVFGVRKFCGGAEINPPSQGGFNLPVSVENPTVHTASSFSACFAAPPTASLNMWPRAVLHSPVFQQHSKSSPSFSTGMETWIVIQWDQTTIFPQTNGILTGKRESKSTVLSALDK